MPDAVQRREPTQEPFYVGYLGMPPAFRRFLGRLVPALALGALALGLSLASRQQDPGTGSWELDHSVTLEGLLELAPYPLLHVPPSPTGEAPHGPFLLVSEGKFGTADRARPLAGQSVRATGHLIRRAGGDGPHAFALLELIPGAEALVAAPAGAALAQSSAASWQTRGPVELSGQIIDPKCYLGVMKPGGGKVHKACAIRCISGGIPPVFLSIDGSGQETPYLIAGPDGGAITEALLPFVGEPVSASGTLEERAGLLRFRLAPATLHRL